MKRRAHQVGAQEDEREGEDTRNSYGGPPPESQAYRRGKRRRRVARKWQKKGSNESHQMGLGPRLYPKQRALPLAQGTALGRGERRHAVRETAAMGQRVTPKRQTPVQGGLGGRQYALWASPT